MALVVFVVVLSRSFVQILPYQQGVVTRLGRYQRTRFNPISPIAYVAKVDVRAQVLAVPRQEVITQDRTRARVDAAVTIKVVDPVKAVFAAANYRQAVIDLTQSTFQALLGGVKLDDILADRLGIDSRARDTLDQSTRAWGVQVVAAELREVEPIGSAAGAPLRPDR